VWRAIAPVAKQTRGAARRNISAHFGALRNMESGGALTKRSHRGAAGFARRG
jgi:hypothetical protein